MSMIHPFGRYTSGWRYRTVTIRFACTTTAFRAGGCDIVVVKIWAGQQGSLFCALAHMELLSFERDADANLWQC
jgi:hypothetical protein